MGNSLSPENFFVSYQKKRYPVHVIAAKLPEKNAEESIDEEFHASILPSLIS